jgi:ABC-type polysaccharide/polyol phosphate export systems, permease component
MTADEKISSAAANLASSPPQSDDPVRLPQKPLVIIVPSGSWVGLNPRDLWAYRELLYFLTWRDVKVRYKQTVLGATWVILQPLLMMVIFSLLFGRVAGMPSDGIPYPLFAYGGLLAWTFFATAITTSGNSLVGSAHLITKVYFPRMIIPGAAVCAAAVDFALAFVVLVPLMFYYHVTITWQLTLLPFLILVLMVLALGVGMWMSAMRVKYRDVRVALPFVTQIWMFLSPVIYPLSRLPPKVRLVMMLNPVAGIVEGFRSALFGLPVNWRSLAASTVLSILVLACAAFTFRRMEKEFADLV